jgi:hypothetical protein
MGLVNRLTRVHVRRVPGRGKEKNEDDENRRILSAQKAEYIPKVSMKTTETVIHIYFFFLFLSKN